MKNHCEKMLESHWKLCGWSEARLDRSRAGAWWLGAALRLGGHIAGLGGVFLMIPLAGRVSLLTLFVLSLSLIGLGLAMDRLGIRCEERGERLSRVSEGRRPGEALRRVKAAAANSQRAREWKDDAAWEGQELRMFDVEAMEALAYLEEKGVLTAWSRSAMELRTEAS